MSLARLFRAVRVPYVADCIVCEDGSLLMDGEPFWTACRAADYLTYNTLGHHAAYADGCYFEGLQANGSDYLDRDAFGKYQDMAIAFLEGRI